ncbi:unnamed protein product [Arabidopsis thaliana]|uniref:(thale cress) hypothetical protein n=1 Tax=Arabidopsis thaliana TaxID=3702 RepID=A0A7G2EYZ4_ARATH|nr:unnamed protein product [Arabidopsis thaliana]
MEGTSTWILNYESKTHIVDHKNSGFFSISIQGIERILIRSPSGRETFAQQKSLGENSATVRIASEIPPVFLTGEEICSIFVANVLSKSRINKWIQQSIVPKICKDLIDIRRHLEEEEKDGFLVEVEVEVVLETLYSDWLRVNDYDSKGCLIPTEEECIICLEELSSSGSERRIMKLLCSHSFHKDCILPWLRCKRSCPTCRDDIHNPRAEEDHHE